MTATKKHGRFWLIMLAATGLLGFATGSQAWAQTPDLPEIRQKALKAMENLQSERARQLVSDYKSKATNPNSPNVSDLEKRLRKTITLDKRAKKLVSDINTLTTQREFGKAELLLAEFGRLEKRARDKYGDDITDATVAVENYWRGVSASVTAGLNTGDFQMAKKVVDEGSLQLIDPKDRPTGTIDPEHPRATLVSDLKQKVADAETKVDEDKKRLAKVQGPVAPFERTPVDIARAPTTTKPTHRTVVAAPVVNIVNTKTTPESETPPTTIAGWTLFSIGSAAAIAGGIFLGLGYADYHEWDSADAENGIVQDMTRVDANTLADSAEWKLNTGLGLAIGGGAALVTGIVLLALPSSESTNVSWTPGAGSGTLTMSF